MKLNLKPRNFSILKNFEFFFVLLLILISILITQIYNSSKKQAQNEYLKVFSNLYFQKTLNNIFNNFSPKYLKIEHIVAPNESINSILKKYEIKDNESNLINKELKSKLKKFTLKVNQKISFIIDKENNKISKFIFPVSKTRQLLFTRDMKSDEFIYTNIVTNLNKKTVYKEGQITQSLYRSAIRNKIPAHV